MYKSTSRAEQFMDRSGSFATHGTRGGADLLGIGKQEQLTPEQKRAAMVASVVSLEERISYLSQIDRTEMPLQRKQDLNAEIKALGTKKYNLQCEITKLNKKLQRNEMPPMADFIIAVVREQMTKPQWAAIVLEAKRRYEAQEKSDEAAQPAAK